MIISAGFELFLMAQKRTRWEFLQVLANELIKEKRFIDALKVALDSLEEAQETYGPNHICTANSLYNVGRLNSKLGRLEEAEKYLRAAYGLHLKLLGRDDPKVSFDMNELANVLILRKKYVEAEKLFMDSLQFHKAANYFSVDDVVPGIGSVGFDDILPGVSGSNDNSGTEEKTIYFDKGPIIWVTIHKKIQEVINGAKKQDQEGNESGATDQLRSQKLYVSNLINRFVMMLNSAIYGKKSLGSHIPVMVVGKRQHSKK